MVKLRSREFPCVLQKGTTSRESFATTKCSHFFKKGRTLPFGCNRHPPPLNTPKQYWWGLYSTTYSHYINHLPNKKAYNIYIYIYIYILYIYMYIYIQYIHTCSPMIFHSLFIWSPPFLPACDGFAPLASSSRTSRTSPLGSSRKRISSSALSDSQSAASGSSWTGQRGSSPECHSIGF